MKLPNGDYAFTSDPPDETSYPATVDGDGEHLQHGLYGSMHLTENGYYESDVPPTVHMYVFPVGTYAAVSELGEPPPATGSWELT